MYGSLVDADAYHAARGTVSWTGDDAAKLAALLRGSEWLYGSYSALYSGMPNPYDGDPIEQPVEFAAYIAASYELASPGALSPAISRGPTVKRTQVGPISKEFFEPGDDLSGGLPKIAAVEALMRPYLNAPYLPFMVV